MKIACLIAYEHRPQRHGGVKRSSQWVEAAGELGIASHSIRNLKGPVLFAALTHPFQLLRVLAQAVVLVVRRGVALGGALKFISQSTLLEKKLIDLEVTAAIIETWS